MKYNLLILGLILNVISVLTVSAQEKKTLMQGNNATVERNMSLYGELGLKVMTVKGDAAPGINANIGVGFNEHISAGIAFQTSLSNLQPDAELDPEVFYNLYFGSLFFEYNWNPKSVFSVSTPIHFGAGINKLINETGEDVVGLENDRVSVIMPSIKGNLNVSPRMSLNLNLGYRILGLIKENRGLTNSDMSGFEAGVGLKLNIL